MLTWFRRWRDQDVILSPRWLKYQQSRESRIEFHGVSWQWDRLKEQQQNDTERTKSTV